MGDRLPARQFAPNTILILRALHLGDLLCAIPAWRALRASLPQAEILLVGLPWTRGFVQRFHNYLDGLVEFPGFPGLPEREAQIQRIPSFLHDIQARGFDLALQMHGSGGTTNPLIALFGAQQTAGFTLPGQYCPQPQNFIHYPAHLPEVRRHLALMAHLGFYIPADNKAQSEAERLEFPLTPADAADFAALGLEGLDVSRIVCIHPGARAEARRWSPEKFAAVADRLAAEGFQIVLTGTQQETALTLAVQRAMHFPALDLAGKTSLGALAVLLSRARLLVCNDTGVSHLADALITPSVVIFTISDPNQWAPLDRRLHRIVCNGQAASPEVVLEQALDCLSQERIYA